MAIAGCGISDRISEDRITEGWIYWDALGLVQQLSRVLAPEELDAGVVHHLEAGG